MENNSLQSAVGVMRGPSLDEERERLVPQIKEFRQIVDGLIQRFSMDLKDNSLIPRVYTPLNRMASEQVLIHLTDAKMWAGKILEGLGNPFPAELADKASSN